MDKLQAIIAATVVGVAASATGADAELVRVTETLQMGADYVQPYVQSLTDSIQTLEAEKYELRKELRSAEDFSVWLSLSGIAVLGAVVGYFKSREPEQ